MERKVPSEYKVLRVHKVHKGLKVVQILVLVHRVHKVRLEHLIHLTLDLRKMLPIFLMHSTKYRKYVVLNSYSKVTLKD
jgi:hypothetical protein